MFSFNFQPEDECMESAPSAPGRSFGIQNENGNDIYTEPLLEHHINLKVLQDENTSQQNDQTTMDLDNEQVSTAGSSEKPKTGVYDVLVGIKSETDIVKGSYEENLKVLELGCGSALPSLHVLLNTSKSIVHMQDYNSDVIQLITIPNVLLNTALQSAACERCSTENTFDEEGYLVQSAGECEIDLDEFRGHLLYSESEDVDKKKGGDEVYELSEDEVTQADAIILNSPFANSKGTSAPLSSRVKFFSGSWSEYSSNIARENPNSYDMIFTSETIYETSTHMSLYECIKNSLKKQGSNDTNLNGHVPAAYVAAKSVYFGLDGSIYSFKTLLETFDEMKVEVVWKSTYGVNREILKLTWK
ncbi:Histidine protein methyltransferase-like protein [Zancudomyces culisetae]|uniref:protein-histidine N-methyltransferase n=1 Tax=Zancudomyces culisetae TaxID=1213189 RepID=A0A1R1PI99_ZANCU|nr:Histidine protein methyltransferase-like protein [Zancudomyces culisetae]|eukprot:OMH80633.1 Histidine protein methyltransferase-like protein [Zancudomyces culisetae]